MRRIHQKQQTLTPVWSAHEHAKELEAISGILDSNPTIAAVAALPVLTLFAKEFNQDGSIVVSYNLLVMARHALH